MPNVFTERLGPAPLWAWGLGGIGLVVGFRLLKGGGIGSGSGQTALVANPSLQPSSGGGTDTTSLLTQLSQAEQQSFKGLADALTAMGKQQQDAMTALAQADFAQSQSMQNMLAGLAKSQTDQLTAFQQSNQSFEQQLLSLMKDTHTPVAQPAPQTFSPSFSIPWQQPLQQTPQQSSFNAPTMVANNLRQLLSTMPTPLPGVTLTPSTFLNYNTLGNSPLTASNLVVVNNAAGGQSLASRSGAGVPVQAYPGGPITYYRPQVAI